MTDASQRGEVVVVPATPTPEMLRAGFHCDSLANAWALMLAAAPPAPSGDSGALIRAALHDADDISGRIVAGNYRGNLSDTETLRNHVRKLCQALALRDAGGGSLRPEERACVSSGDVDGGAGR